MGNDLKKDCKTCSNMSIEVNLSRRQAIKNLAGTVAGVMAYNAFPSKWSTPIIDQVFLPAHAATSGATGIVGVDFLIVSHEVDADNGATSTIFTITIQNNSTSSYTVTTLWENLFWNGIGNSTHDHTFDVILPPSSTQTFNSTHDIGDTNSWWVGNDYDLTATSGTVSETASGTAI